jgi:hypothetical protein
MVNNMLSEWRVLYRIVLWQPPPAGVLVDEELRMRHESAAHLLQNHKYRQWVAFLRLNQAALGY